LNFKEGEEMLVKNAAMVAYTRLKYIGFPKDLLVSPADISEEFSKKLISYVHDSMESIAELRSIHKYSKVVIAEQGYLVIGITAYLRDIADSDWEGADKGGRLVYGFFGYIWKKEDFVCKGGFPAIEEFRKILDEWIRPHWEDSEFSRWAEMKKVSSYTSEVQMKTPFEFADYQPPVYVGKVNICKGADESRLTQWALNQAVNGKDLSVCTNLCLYSAKDYVTSYQYISTLKDEYSTANTDEMKVPVEKKGEEPVKEEKKNSNWMKVLILFVAAVIFGLYVPGGKILLVCIVGFILLLGLRFLLVSKKEEKPPVEVKTPTKKSETKQKTNQKETTEDIFRL